jgi:hypothetical protein
VVSLNTRYSKNEVKFDPLRWSLGDFVAKTGNKKQEVNNKELENI